MNYYKELYKILDDIFHDDLDTEKMLQEEATNKFIDSLLKDQRKICAGKYWDAEYRDIRKMHIYEKIENAPKPKGELK